GRLPESQAKVYHLDLEPAKKVFSMQDTDEAEPAEVQEVIEVVTAVKLMTEDTDEAEPAEVQEVIEVVTAAKLMTEVVTTAATTITAAQVPKASAPRKRKDKGKGILIEEPKPLKRQAQIKHDEAFARQLEAELNANINLNDVVDQVKRKEKQDNTVIRYQSLKRKPKGENEIEEEGSKRKSDSLGQRAAKKQRIDEEEE
nr:hypothetical protein [Tanacetum cinerariifolium]